MDARIIDLFSSAESATRAARECRANAINALDGSSDFDPVIEAASRLSAAVENLRATGFVIEAAERSRREAAAAKAESVASAESAPAIV